MSEAKTHFKETTDANFETEVLSSPRPVIVGVWASWSAPCDLMAPSFGDLEEQFNELVKVLTLNVDQSPVTACSYEIETLPTMLLFKGGQMVRKISGAAPRTELQALFEEAIAPD